MAYKIAVASGKGGTGKTTVSLNLFKYIQSEYTDNILLVDCDVEEPNVHIFFNDKKNSVLNPVKVLFPEFNVDACTFCNKCVDYCEFNAISLIKSKKYIHLQKDLCHSCGACSVACKHNAITEVSEQIGEVLHYNVGIGKGVSEGRLKIGSALQTTVINNLKAQQDNETEIIIFDAPPGNSCPVVETVSDADFVVLVTEPTPFGLHDLKITIALLQDMKKDFSVVVNKAGLGDNQIYKFLEANNIELLGEIPFNKAFASDYASAEIFNNENVDITKALENIVDKVIKRIFEDERNNYFEW